MVSDWISENAFESELTMSHENWKPCGECGTPRLEINQSTPEACSVCKSRASVLPTYLGSVAIGLASVATLGLIAGSVAILL